MVLREECGNNSAKNQRKERQREHCERERERRLRVERLLRELLPGLGSAIACTLCSDQFRVYSLAPPVTLGLTKFYPSTASLPLLSLDFEPYIFPPSQCNIHTRHNRSAFRPSYWWPTLHLCRPKHSSSLHCFN